MQILKNFFTYPYIADNLTVETKKQVWKRFNLKKADAIKKLYVAIDRLYYSLIPYLVQKYNIDLNQCHYFDRKYTTINDIGTLYEFEFENSSDVPYYYWSPLQYAIFKNNKQNNKSETEKNNSIKCIIALLENGADVNYINLSHKQSSLCPLFYVHFFQNDTSTLKLLLNQNPKMQLYLNNIEPKTIEEYFSEIPNDYIEYKKLILEYYVKEQEVFKNQPFIKKF